MPRHALYLEPGNPLELGATLTDDGINFAVWSPEAERLELCLFDAKGNQETARLVFHEQRGGVWHGHLPGGRAGLRYGLRAYGEYKPAEGLLFNAHKLLVDPYAKALDRPFTLHPSVFGFDPDHPGRPDHRDSAAHVPKTIVLPALAPFSGEGPRYSGGQTIIYELHVRGLTMLHPKVPKTLRGQLAALRQPAVISYLQTLGVTTLELLPIAAWADDRHLPALGLANYWGYNPVTMMAVDPRLAGRDALMELRETVAALHAAGFEVILDVVFNHTGEGDELGPTLCMRGLDNRGYYRLHPDDPAVYINDSGCGNCLALQREPALRLTMDALRHWVQAAGVDGFRFDLAPALGRLETGFSVEAPLMQAIQQDPVLRQVKLIAEPWDIGPGGYQVGQFRSPWSEWNDSFRDDVRKFWRGDAGMRGALATRLAGSADLFDHHGRDIDASINFITAHDGFTLADLVTYAHKHNEANGEENRDGTQDNYSWNNGVEGPTDDPHIIEQRAADQRALLATLLLAGGTPMLTAGDEFGRTQHGNNNAYVQDTPMSWMDWQLAASPAGQRRWAFTQRLIALRRRYKALQAEHFIGRQASREWVDVRWLDPEGEPLHEDGWKQPDPAPLAFLLAPMNGSGDLVGERLWLCFQPLHHPQTCRLPAARDGHHWLLLLDSARSELELDHAVYSSAESLALGRGVSIAVELLRP
ncbi:glycogen operon protein [Pseudomonas duriflava]|uniref:Glycogen operon protein n=1 Tax=Pseudomonas duriflava TaxID=459528 RepID=A0A562QDR1_9PSED|nr:glycogen debranching protein GlgX [Pseudomonas duriflava]TWI54833.1 glycogen operon protein [Pseudomonas duriflava]